MTINMSNTPAAAASRKWRMMNPEKALLSSRLYTRTHKAQQKAWHKAWNETHREYVREYFRLSNLIAKARKAGDAESARKYLVERQLHRQSLRNRMTLGNQTNH